MSHTARHSCGATWIQVASRTAHCCSCHRTFASEKIFDGHRNEGKCVDPSTILNKEHKPAFETFTDRAGGTIWRSTKKMTEIERARIRAATA